MPCEHSPYATSGPANYCANYDWGPKHTTAYDDPSEISPYGYAYRNCTDYVAWELASLGVPSNVYKGHGNGAGWAKVAGLVTNTNPAVGAVAVQTSGTFGHVAFISAVVGSTITVSEYNHGENGTYDSRSGTLSGLGFNDVTHFEGYETGHGGGGYAAAFQANTGNLFTWVSTGGGVNTGQGMMAGTSPSITALSNGGYAVAFQANTGNLFTWVSTGGGVNTGQGMKGGTSPSITALSNGSYAIGFEANTANLFTWVSTGGGVNTGQGMMAGTSPSITALSNGSYAIGFEANTANLFTWVSTGGGVNTGQGMKGGTSPGVAR
jgi:surface antigen